MRYEELSINELTVNHCNLHGELAGMFGQKFYVGGANGSNGNSGLSANSAFGTIQAGITAQIANTSGYGDVIYVAPGTYVESLTGNLTLVELIGAGLTPGAVQITPETSYSYTGKLTNAAIRNMHFRSPSVSSKELAAMLIVSDTTYSAIDHNQFYGADAECTVALQIGSATAVTGWEQLIASEITNNFVGAGDKSFDRAIAFWAHAPNAYDGQKMTKGCLISGNRLQANYDGVRINSETTHNRDTVISYNIIGNNENYKGPERGVHLVCGEDRSGCMVIYNTITATLDPVRNFPTGNVIGNLVSDNGGAPASLSGHNT